MREFDINKMNTEIKVRNYTYESEDFHVETSMDISLDNENVNAVISDVSLLSQGFSVKNKTDIKIHGPFDEIVIDEGRIGGNLMDISFSGKVKEKKPALNIKGKIFPSKLDKYYKNFIQNMEGDISLDLQLNGEEVVGFAEFHNNSMKIKELGTSLSGLNGKIEIVLDLLVYSYETRDN